MPTAEPTLESAAAAAAAATAPRAGKGLFLSGGIVALVALAWALSLVAVPSGGADGDSGHHAIQGPFVADISPSAGFQVNLAGDGGKHYLSLNVKAEVDAFEEAYVGVRADQPLHQAKLTDAVLRIASQKTKSELDHAVGREVFREELRVELDPVLFPVHVGDEHEAEGRHEESGLRPGRSVARSTMRGLFYEHRLHLDATRKTIRLDDGQELSFRGDEEDLFVTDARGQGVYVDVGALEPGFAGQVHVGTFGRVRNVYFSTFLTQ
jgi:flagellar basal body-associated protein FliL